MHKDADFIPVICAHIQQDHCLKLIMSNYEILIIQSLIIIISWPWALDGKGNTAGYYADTLSVLEVFFSIFGI